MAEHGLSLSEARLARGLTLEDVERSTRISRRFLAALEERDYSVFAAPIYARGFLRTYCRFLGLNPEQLLSEMPDLWSANSLPAMSRKFELQPGWLAGGLLGLFILVALALTSLSPGGERDSGNSRPAQEEAAAVQEDPVLEVSSSLQQTPAGVLADFSGVAVTEALAFLGQRQLGYLVVEASIDPAREGLVVGQSPAAGAPVQPGDVVTLRVSRSSAAGRPVRTDCNALGATSVRSEAEQRWFQNSCLIVPPGSSDRTSCDQIRGTAYRSEREREFYLESCTG